MSGAMPSNPYLASFRLGVPSSPGGEPGAVNADRQQDATMPESSGQVQITITAQENSSVTESALEGLTVQQMLDYDIDSLAVKVDRHHSNTKKAILDHVMDLKVRLMGQQTAAVEEERRAGNSRLAAKQEEVNLLQQELANGKADADHLDEFLHRMSCAYDAAKHRQRSHALMSQAFYAWRQHAMLGKRRARLLAKADTWYTQVHLKRHVLLAWFKVALKQHRVTLNDRFLAEVEAAKLDIGGLFQAQLDSLRRQLQDAHTQLVSETEAREKLEENMKQAFMRGVCALNIEAMSIMKRGQPAGGINPFPTGAPKPLGGPPPAGGGDGQHDTSQQDQSSHPSAPSSSSNTAPPAAPTATRHAPEGPGAGEMYAAGAFPNRTSGTVYRAAPGVSSTDSGSGLIPARHVSMSPHGLGTVRSSATHTAPPPPGTTTQSASMTASVVTTTLAPTPAALRAAGGPGRQVGVSVTRGPAADAPRPRASVPQPAMRPFQPGAR